MPTFRDFTKEQQFQKNPEGIRDIEFRWTSFLGVQTDTISTGTFRILAGDGALVISNEQQFVTSMIVWLASGTHQTFYEVESEIYTVGGRRWFDQILLKVVD